MSLTKPDLTAETEDETLHKKRARRVSFAETTAVHFFNRDEDSETPNQDSAGTDSVKLPRTDSDDFKELFQDSDDDEFDGGGVAIDESFLRPGGSPSPGSCPGSATSNDEDNFFGPVSANFIRPGRLSDSAASNENHDLTMDSTAFSMHFRSLARSDSGGEFKTPTGVRLAFGEKTPGQTSSGDSMVLTAARKRISHSPLAADKFNDSGNSDDMSVVGENLHRYDYGKLPDELDILLTEGSNDMEGLGLANHDGCSNSSSFMEKNNSRASDRCRQELCELIGTGDAGIFHTTDLQKTSNQVISALHADMVKNNDHITDACPGETTCNQSIDMYDPAPKSPSSDRFQAPVLERSVMTLDRENGGIIAVEATGMFESPPSFARSSSVLEGSTARSNASLLAEHRNICRDSDNPPEVQLNSSMFEKDFYSKDSNKHAWSTSFFAKSVSRLKRLQAFPFVSASKVERNASRLAFPGSLTRPITISNGGKDSTHTGLDALVACLDSRFSNTAECSKGFNTESKMDNHGLVKNGDSNCASNKEQVCEGTALSGLHATLLPGDKNSRSLKFSTSTTTPGKMLENDTSKHKHKLELELHAIDTLQSMRSDCSEISFSDLKDSKKTGGRDSVLSPGNEVERKVSASPLYEVSVPMNVDLQDGNQKQADKLASNASDLSETGAKLPTFTRVLPAQCLNFINGSTPTSNTRAAELPLQVFESRKKELSLNLLQKEVFGLADEGNVLFSARKGSATLRSLELMSKNDVAHILQKPPYPSGSVGSPCLKRKLFDESKGDNDECDFLQRKKKLFKDQKHGEETSEISNSLGSDSAVRDWTHVFTKFCGAASELISPAIDQPNVRLIKVLIDALVHLEKIKSYELLHFQVGSEKAFDAAGFLYNRRLADTKSLLYKVVFEKAKLQLMRLMQDKLLEKIHLVNSRVEESGKLISSRLHLHIRGEENIQIDSLLPKSCSTDNGCKQLAATEISSLKKEFEDSDVKLRNLTQSFLAFTKVSEEFSGTNIIACVEDLVKKRDSCQSMLANLQLCEIDSLKAIRGQPNILLRYGGFLSQRLIVKSSTSGLSISNTLDNAKISKTWLDIDAHVAFSFVSSGATHLPYEGLRTITQETQKTNSRLHTLIDIIEEVELAMVEFRNLTHSRFCQPSAGKLDLQLCFTDFSSGARVTLIVDLTCLLWGVYPSENLPYEVQSRAARKNDSVELLVANIRTALQGIRCGYMRITSICRCVSRMILADDTVC